MAPSKETSDSGLSVNGTKSEVSKASSPLVDDIDISVEEKGDSSLGLVGGLSVAAQRKDEYDINFEYGSMIFPLVGLH